MGSFNFDGYPPNSRWGKGAGPLASPAPSASIERSWHVFEHLIGKFTWPRLRFLGLWLRRICRFARFRIDEFVRTGGGAWLGVFSEQALLKRESCSSGTYRRTTCISRLEAVLEIHPLLSLKKFFAFGNLYERRCYQGRPETRRRQINTCLGLKVSVEVASHNPHCRGIQEQLQE